MKIPRIVIAGTTSGIGKTSITTAIIYTMKKCGYTVQPFKVGPDYIDPSYLSAISGNGTRNLDVWLMGKNGVVKSFVKSSKSSISIIEGVMGFYDGFSGNSNFASTHHVASILKSPVILVLDASKTARSIAATVLGYTKFHRNSNIIGLIINKVGSKKHELLCRQALEKLKTPILGVIPKNPDFILESRHLGLIPILEQNSLKKRLEKITKKIAEYIDTEKIIELSKKTEELPKTNPTQLKKPKTTICVALDNSFNFYYHDNLDALKREGARIKIFSPIYDSNLPTCDGLYIGGGFPEILSDSLAKNQKMRKSIKNAAENNIPIYAECGGLMYLTRSISYGNKKHQMIGLFDAETRMDKKMKLNYTKGKISSNCLISPKSDTLQGHEFHYSEIDISSSDSKFAYTLSIGDGIKNKQDGLMEYNTLASYMHLYFDHSKYAKNFVQNCVKFSKR
ncbi:MAG: cobyrinate a,c-diamide synthase [Nitrososphaerota archaeon]